MQAISSFLMKLNHPLLIFVVLGLRAGVFGSSIGDAIFLIGYLGFLGYHKYLENLRKEDINDKVKSEIAELRTMVSTMGLKSGIKPQDIPSGKRFF